jgi:hypothetical protein
LNRKTPHCLIILMNHWRQDEGTNLLGVKALACPDNLQVELQTAYGIPFAHFANDSGPDDYARKRIAYFYVRPIKGSDHNQWGNQFQP